MPDWTIDTRCYAGVGSHPFPEGTMTFTGNSTGQFFGVQTKFVDEPAQYYSFANKTPATINQLSVLREMCSRISTSGNLYLHHYEDDALEIPGGDKTKRAIMHQDMETSRAFDILSQGRKLSVSVVDASGRYSGISKLHY